MMTHRIRLALIALVLTFTPYAVSGHQGMLLLGVGRAGTTPSILVDLISAWKLDEASGDAIDAHGSNTLTDNNTVGTISGERDFESTNSEFFSIASNASLQAGDIDFTFMIKVTPETTSGVILGKDVDTPVNSRNYTLDYNSGAPRFYINGGDGGLVVTWSAELTVATPYYIFAGHDSVANTIWITVDNGTVRTTATGGTAPDTGTAQFRIGAREYTGFESYADGLKSNAAFWKRKLTADEITCLYNGGTGRVYPYTAC